ncbi:hypothetical protein MKX01_035720 [Papaver californicum]|nr:hypothetical protein MKX01_035720 [Papaver californicum]
MENLSNGENQRSSENLGIFNQNVNLHTSYQTQCFINEEESLDEMIDSTCSSPYVSAPSSPGSNRDYNNNNGYFYTADELFFNGQIRPMKLSSHLQKPQILTPLLDLENEVEEDEKSVLLKREGRLRNGLRRDERKRAVVAAVLNFLFFPRSHDLLS